MMGAIRGRNEGSIYERKSKGLWVAEVTLPSGKRKQMYAKTKREAQERLREYEKNRALGVAELDSTQTVSQFFQNWLDSVAKPSLRASTFEGHEGIVRTRILPHLGKLKLQQVTPQHLQSLYTKLSDDGLSPASIVRTHAVLHGAFKRALLWNLIYRNPADGAQPPKVARREFKTLTHEQVGMLLESATSHTFRALYALAATTGMRRGELLGLKWSDVDLERRRVQLRRTLQRVKGAGLVEEEPKTSSSRRHIALTNLAVAELKEHRTKQKEQRLAAGAAWEGRDLVFCTALGRPLDEGSVSRNYKKALSRAELPDVRLHDLRHTAATLLLQEGVNPKVVQEMLGHSTIKVTLDLYSHVTPHMQQAAADALDRLFAGGVREAVPV